MTASYKGMLIGGGIGLFTGITGPDYTMTAMGLITLVCGLLGWAIGRYLEMRKPRR